MPRPHSARSGVFALCFALAALLLLVAAAQASSPAAAATPAQDDWAAWESLPPEAKAKVDPRILEELRGQAAPAYRRPGAPAVVAPGEPITYTVYVRNSGGSRVQGQMADALPPELAYQPGSLVCGSGACGFASGVITWTGVVEAHSMVPVRFRAVASPALIEDAVLTNTAVIIDVAGGVRYRAWAQVQVSGPGGQTRTYLPIIMREQ